MVVLDTCAIIELCKQRPRLSPACLKETEKEAHVLSVSFAEIALKIKKNRLILDITAREIYENYRSVSTVHIADIGCVEWFDSIDLEWSNKDSADRMIVAYAQRRGIPIVTNDGEIKKFYPLVLW